MNAEQQKQLITARVTLEVERAAARKKLKDRLSTEMRAQLADFDSDTKAVQKEITDKFAKEE